MQHPVALQIYALSHEDRSLTRALLELAAWDLFPNDAGIHFNLAVVNQDMGHELAATRGYEQALRLDPCHSGALNNLSDLWRRQGRSADAWRLVCRYVEAGHDAAGLELRFAKIADDAGLAREARAWFARAVVAAPADPQVQWEKAMADLREGRLAEGWYGYEARSDLFSHEVLGQVAYSMPRWDGSPLAGRNLLLHKEQGLGDMIMFAGCLSDVAVAQGETVHLALQAPLVRLFRHNFPQMRVWPGDSQVGEGDERFQTWLSQAGHIDCQLPMASLGGLFRREGFPRPRAYLTAPEAAVAEWAERLRSLGAGAQGRMRVGLVLSARRDGANARGVCDGEAKSVPAGLAGLLAENCDCDWIGLHDRRTVDLSAGLRGIDCIDTSPWLFDLADTAALIANLDLVIAVDTAVAHLAAAMGRKVLLLLRKQADFRWSKSRRDTRWYPDVELFRQTYEGDWHDPLKAAGLRLASLATRHHSSGEPARAAAARSARRRG